jgi:hypothetical protein
VKVNEAKAKENDEKGVYLKLDIEMRKLQDQMDKANMAKKMLDDFF